MKSGYRNIVGRIQDRIKDIKQQIDHCQTTTQAPENLGRERSSPTGTRGIAKKGRDPWESKAKARWRKMEMQTHEPE